MELFLNSLGKRFYFGFIRHQESVKMLVWYLDTGYFDEKKLHIDERFHSQFLMDCAATNHPPHTRQCLKRYQM